MLWFCAFQSHRQSASETAGGQGRRDIYTSSLANTAMVPPSNKSVCVMPSKVTTCHRSPDLTICTGQDPSIISKTTTNSLSLVREVYQRSGLSNSAVSIIMNSWRASTKKQYQVYYNKWIHYCDSNDLDIHSVSVNQVLEFLTFLFQKESSYSALNTARSALSSIITLTDTNYTVSNHRVIERFMKGSFNYRPSLPSLPRYTCIWDTSVVLKYLKSLAPTDKVGLKLLTHKLVMLFALLAGQRAQSLQYMDITSMTLLEDQVIFHIGKCIKQTRPGFHIKPLVFHGYTPDRDLCVLSALKAYLQQTQDLRANCTKLFISTQKPHNAVSINTISRWIKNTVSVSGIDITKYKGHSTGAASLSAAQNTGIPVHNIMAAAGWSSKATFSKFYNKSIHNADNFSEAVLKSCEQLDST